MRDLGHAVLIEHLDRRTLRHGGAAVAVVERVSRAEGACHLEPVVVDVDDDELVKRLSTRTVCEGCQTPYMGRDPGTECEKCGGRLIRRKDDEPEAVRNRLEVYRRQTAPVIDWYRDHKMKVLDVDADAPVDEVTARAVKALGK